MKAIVIHGARDLRIEERKTHAPGPGEVAVRVARGGICGTDLHYYQNGGFGTVKLREPMILGHEVSGYVEALGDEVAGLALGDLVAVSPSRPDWHDPYAREGMPQHSAGMRFYGSAMKFPHVQGAFRQLLLVRLEQCVKADGLTPAEAAMAEPLSVVLHALKQMGDINGGRVLVTGCGPIGALAVLALRRAGAAEIVVTDVMEGALKLARSCGADCAVNVATDPDALAPFAANKGYFHAAVECAGAAPALISAIACVRARGVIVQVGLGGEVSVPMDAIVSKELEIRGSFRFH
ncbi:MAG: L-idonate 5-dehydrogenase, partial [Cucumibacter sp.]